SDVESVWALDAAGGAKLLESGLRVDPVSRGPAARLRLVAVLLLDGDDLVQMREEQVQDAWIEVRSSTAFQGRIRLFVGERLLVGARAGQRVEDIGHGADPAVERDPFSFQAIRVAAAVPFFMMREDDDLSCPQELRG